MKIDWIKLVFSILICQAAGIIGSLFTYNSITTWYASLQKPWFVPPNWLFAPAWTTLYILMGLALYLVLLKGWKGKNAKIGITFFSIQLALNSLWSILFFGLKDLFISLIEIGFMWVFILLTIIQFWKIDRRASIMLIPYLGWVTFASALNYYVWLLNA